MKHPSKSRWEDEEIDDGRGGPRGERSSGVRTRSAPRPPQEPEVPCASFEQVYELHGPYIWRRACGRFPFDADDAAELRQRVLIRVDRRIRDLDGSVPYPLRPVLLGLIDDEARNLKRDRERLREDREPDSGVPASKPDPQALFERAEHQAQLARDLRAVVLRMRREEMDLIQIAEDEEEPLKDVAQRLGVSESALRVRLHRARAKLAALYNHHVARRKP